MIAGTQSGVGKTTLTAGLLWALRRRGRRVVPFKVGPDYIDPGFHTAAAGVPAGNLDSWMMPSDQVLETLWRRACGGSLTVIEGVMGLYDGRKGDDALGSSAQVAKITRTPVLLVASGAKMAQSAAALVGGYVHFDPELSFAGVVFNQVAGESHYRLLREAVHKYLKVPVLGYLPRDMDISIPERHLGLRPVAEMADAQCLLDKIADLVERTVDVPAILAAAVKAPPLPPPRQTVFPAETAPLSCRIAVARDEAFHFYYQENLELLAALGAELVEFSPLADQQLPACCDGVYLGGGFPELFAAELSANERLRHVLVDAAAEGRPIYAECGGYMYLARELSDLEGQKFPMAGVFPGQAVMRNKRRALGYIEVTAARKSFFLRAGEVARGHEFHWSEMEGASNEQPLYHKLPGGEPVGELYQNCAGSYIHLHFLSNPHLASNFVAACRQFRQRREKTDA